MNAIQRTLAKALLGIDIKASKAGPAIVATNLGTPIWPTRDYAHFAKEGYIDNVITYRCIQIIGQASGAIPLALAQKGKKLDQPDHELLKLIDRPSPNMTGSDLLENIASFIKIAGNAYIEKVKPSRASAQPKELYSLRPDRMKVLPGRNGVPSGFQYDVNGQSIKWDVDPVTGMGDILHLKTFHPTDDWYGLSAIQPGAYSIDQHNEAAKHNFAILQNGAVPSGALTFHPVVTEGQVVMAPQPVIDAAEAKLLERHGGVRNSGKPMVTNGKVEWVEFSQNMEELQLNESKLESARDICSALGVPFILLVHGESTYNNMAEAKLALYEETVLPLFDFILDHLNIWLSPEFGDDLKLVADLDQIDALSPRREEKRTTYVDLLKEKVVTRTEVRDALNFDTLENIPEFAPQNFEVDAVIKLMVAGKLSDETGWKQLANLGILPAELKEDAGVKDERERLDEQNESQMNGLLGLTEDPETGEPIDPLTGKPAAPTTGTPPSAAKPGGKVPPKPVPGKKPPAAFPKPRAVA